MVENHYRWDFIGLSTDDKPTPATSEKVADGSTFYCSDNSKLYVFYKDQWYEKEATGGGGGGDSSVKILTSADNNYHASGDTDDRIAPWLLNDGVYLIDGSDSPVYVAKAKSGTAHFTIEDKCFLTVSSAMVEGTEYKYKMWFIMGLNASNLGGSRPSVGLQQYNPSWESWSDVDNQRSNSSTAYEVLLGNDIINNLTSTSSSGSKRVLSAYQGKVLNDKIDKNSINGSTTAPTTSTVGSVGTLYSCVNSGTAELYMCTAVSGSTYTWTKIV